MSTTSRSQPRLPRTSHQFGESPESNRGDRCRPGSTGHDGPRRRILGLALVFIGALSDVPAADRPVGEIVAADQATSLATHRGHSPTDVLDQVPDLDTADIAQRLVQLGTARDRDPWFARLATAWKAAPKDNGKLAVGAGLASILEMGREHPAFSAAVDRWPLEGSSRLLLLAWHTARGHRQVLDEAFFAAVDEATAKPSPLSQWVRDGDTMGPLLELYGMEASLPCRREVLARMQALLSGPLDQGAPVPVITSLISPWGFAPTLGGMVRRLSPRHKPGPVDDDLQVVPADAGNHLSLLLRVQLLTDLRPAPKFLTGLALTGNRAAYDGWQQYLARYHTTDERFLTQARVKEPISADLRVADAVVACVPYRHDSFGITKEVGHDAVTYGKWYLSLNAPLSEREDLRQRMLSIIVPGLNGCRLPPDCLPLPVAIPGVELQPIRVQETRKLPQIDF